MGSAGLQVTDSRSSESMRQAVLVVSAGFLGWMLDAFDFFLVVVAVPQIAHDFHVSDPDILFSSMLTLAFRPVGAFIFGLLADRFGRRMPMMIDLVFYSAIEFLTAFAPNLMTFYVLRALFGIGMGGEWGVGTSLVMEKVPRQGRGLLSGFLQEGYAAGYLLAGLASYFMLDRFGWRAMFMIGGAPALLAVFIRFAIKESEVWQKNRSESWRHLGRGIAANWKLWLYLTAMMAMLNFSSHGTQDAFPAFMKGYRHLSVATYSKVVMMMMVGAILGGILFGMASDRFGRRIVMVVAFAGALAMVYPWAYASRFWLIVAGAFLMQFFIQGAWGIVPAHISELSPTHVRGFLPGFSYQCGNLIASSIAWMQSRLAQGQAYPTVLAETAACILALAIVVVALGPERRGIDFDDSASRAAPAAGS